LREKEAWKLLSRCFLLAEVIYLVQVVVPSVVQAEDLYLAQEEVSFVVQGEAA
jgi:hypothetical protein